VGTLIASIPPQFHTGITTVDAAVATLSLSQPNSGYGDFILNLGEVRGTADIENFGFPIPVWKYGVTTHLTGGKIVQSAAAIPFFMKTPLTPQQHSVWYNDQLIVEPDPGYFAFSKPGDSGALLLTEDRDAIGLLIGGIQFTGLAVATPISAVIQAISRKLTTEVKFITYP
jgi:hypothetical protein